MSFGEEYLDTERVRGIQYGTLMLRKESHLYLGHGVAVAVGMLLVFWVISANWGLLTSWTGIFGKEEERIISYTGITSVTQLPPPPLKWRSRRMSARSKKSRKKKRLRNRRSRRSRRSERRFISRKVSRAVSGTKYLRLLKRCRRLSVRESRAILRQPAVRASRARCLSVS